MIRVFGALVRVILAVSIFVSLVTLPVDTIAIGDTSPANRPAISHPREKLFIGFSGMLLGYLLWIELRLFLANRLSVREWVPYPVAAQVLYEELKDREVISRLVRESDHPKPVETVMAAWVEDGLWRGLTVLRSSLKKYLRYLEDDTPFFERQLVAKEQA